MKVPYTISDDSVTLFIKGGIQTVASSHGNYQDVVDHLKQEDHDEEVLIELANKETLVSRSLTGTARAEVKYGTVYYDNTQVHNSLSEKLLDLLDSGHDAGPWLAFLENVMENPSYRSRESLYDFLDHFKAPITPDGHFIAFKRVRDNYMDIHSGTMDNSPGSVVSMPRSQVDDDNQRTCSAGLHVCADEYLKGYFGAGAGYRTVAVKVNPRDVVSVPYDYNFSKMRTCQYEVVGDVDEKQQETIIGSDYLEPTEFWGLDDPRDMDDETYFEEEYGYYDED